MTGAGRLEELVAVVTGGASGIGRATAEAMAREGALVAVADRDTVAAASVAAGIQQEGNRAESVRVDIADEPNVIAMVERVVSELGPIDVLVNSAALTDRAHQAQDTTVVDMDLGVWNDTLAVDLTGTMLVCKHVLPHMVAHGSGAIVNVSSNSSLGGDLGLSSYAAAKAGVNSLTRSIATAFGKSGIRCNTVSPAAIEGPTFAANVPRPLIEAMRENCLLPYLGQPSDVASTIVFLASAEARFVTGQLLCVDGGLLSQLPHVADLRRLGLASAVLATDVATTRDAGAPRE
jgi:NAD(P)-dependent dehydrogenase (short-subunit alcohol dehydrogenase family)